MSARDSNTGQDDILQEWNGFGFKYITKADYPLVLAQLHENFYLDEPLHKVAGMTPERQSDLDARLTNVMNLNHGSFFAYPLDNPDKIASVLLIWIHEQGKTLPQSEERSPITAKIRAALIQHHGRCDIHEMYGVEAYPELFVISTDNVYRGKGLATEMYRKAVKQLKSEGHPLVSSTFTNPLSRKIGEKLGFKIVARTDFTEVRNPDGSKTFGNGAEGCYMVETVLLLE